MKSPLKSRLVSSGKIGFSSGLSIFYQLSGIIIPVYVVTAILKLTPAFDYISGIFAPFMKYFGLPGETAVALITGTFINLYAAAAILAGLDLTMRQMTIIALILCISHSQIMETAIVSKMKAMPIAVMTARVFVAIGGGIFLNYIMPG
jgi:spore maturation protein SpmB